LPFRAGWIHWKNQETTSFQKLPGKVIFSILQGSGKNTGINISIHYENQKSHLLHPAWLNGMQESYKSAVLLGVAADDFFVKFPLNGLRHSADSRKQAFGHCRQHGIGADEFDASPVLLTDSMTAGKPTAQRRSSNLQTLCHFHLRNTVFRHKINNYLGMTIHYDFPFNSIIYLH